MSDNFDTVDYKLAETEFFLRRMYEANSLTFQFFLSAYLSAARTATLALQRFTHIPGFSVWYEPHRAMLRSCARAKLLLELRNDHIHGGSSPVGSSRHLRGVSTYYFKSGQHSYPLSESQDIVSICRDHFVTLLEIVYDCYEKLGVYIDPQQYYSREHFVGDIDRAELEVHGWIMSSLIEEGFGEDDRWHELRGCVGECQINHLFYAYLGKATPPPAEPEEYADFAFTPEELGWEDHMPVGFDSREEFLEYQSRRQK